MTNTTQSPAEQARDEDGARRLIAALTDYGTGGGSTALLTGQAIAAAEIIAALQSERHLATEMVAKIKARLPPAIRSAAETVTAANALGDTWDDEDNTSDVLSSCFADVLAIITAWEER